MAAALDKNLVFGSHARMIAVGTQIRSARKEEEAKGSSGMDLKLMLMKTRYPAGTPMLHTKMQISSNSLPHRGAIVSANPENVETSASTV